LSIFFEDLLSYRFHGTKLVDSGICKRR